MISVSISPFWRNSSGAPLAVALAAVLVVSSAAFGIAPIDPRRCCELAIAGQNTDPQTGQTQNNPAQTKKSIAPAEAVSTKKNVSLADAARAARKLRAVSPK
jgi:hypothetical protein